MSVTDAEPTHNEPPQSPIEEVPQITLINNNVADFDPQHDSESGKEISEKQFTGASTLQNRLIECSECGYAISPRATTCPNCGAPNSWLHPEIHRFLNSLDQFATMPRFNFEHEKYVLRGWDIRSKLAAEQSARIMGGLGIWAPLNLSGIATLAFAHFGGEFIQASMNAKVKAFAIDFSTHPPSYRTTDDKHWVKLLKFFSLRNT